MLAKIPGAAMRNLMRDKPSTFVNVVGLCFVIIPGLFLCLYVVYELSYDRYHRNAGSIYRVVSNIKQNGDHFIWTVAQAPLAAELSRDPTVKNVARFLGTGPTTFRNGNHRFQEDGFYLADQTVFKMFSFEFIIGEPETSLRNPNSIVLTEKIAQKYFGGVGSAYQQFLYDETGESYTVTGIMKDVPFNSHFHFDALISGNTGERFNGGWKDFSTITYIQLYENFSTDRLYATLEKITMEKFKPIAQQSDLSVSYLLQPLTQIYRGWKITEGNQRSENGLVFLTAVFFVLVIIAIKCSTKSPFFYTEEYRKKFGERRGEWILHSMMESGLIAMLSLFVSICMIYAMLPFFNNLIAKEIPRSFLWEMPMLACMTGIIIYAALAGALFPAFYFSPPGKVVLSREGLHLV